MKKGTKRPAEPETGVTFELDSKKLVTVRLYNGVPLVDIREFYIDKNTKESKPGKKGIALTEETWTKLLAAQKQISEALATLKGDKKQKVVDGEAEKEVETVKEEED